MSETFEPRYSRYRLTYPSGKLVRSTTGGAAEVRATHPLAVVEACGERGAKNKVIDEILNVVRTTAFEESKAFAAQAE